MRTVSRHRDPSSPHGDVLRLCSYCGVLYYRSQLRRDAAGLLACPDELPGLDSVTLSEGNAELASQKRMGNYDGPSDGSVDSKNTVPSPGFHNPNAPSVAAPFVPGFDKMWVTNLGGSNNKIFGFSGSQATNSGEFSAPAITLTLPSIGIGPAVYPAAICFAANGDLWVGYATTATPGGGQTLARFAASKLLATGSPSADTIIQIPTIDITYEGIPVMCFDGVGGLWVGAAQSSADVSHLLYYTATQLRSSGSPAPTVTLTTALWQSLNGLAFDQLGRLWVACHAHPTIGLTALAPAQLLANNAAIVPSVQLTTGIGVNGLAFDGAGNAWVAQFDASSLMMFSSAQLAATGAVAPVRRLTGTIAAPQQLAFDANQNLWVGEDGHGRVSAFGPADLAQTGSPPPRCTITGAGALPAPYGIAFNPASFHG